TARPGCRLVSWTGESNNLTLVNSSPVSPAPQPAPALVFAENIPAMPHPAASCSMGMGAVSLGDTHLTTFGNLMYDFQASGDFLLAETGPEFQVQTRQVSGAPNWPNAAVNQAVAVQAGTDQVAICLPDKIMIDGKPVSVADGARLQLGGGGAIIR